MNQNTTKNGGKSYTHAIIFCYPTVTISVTLSPHLLQTLEIKQDSFAKRTHNETNIPSGGILHMPLPRNFTACYVPIPQGATFLPKYAEGES